VRHRFREEGGFDYGIEVRIFELLRELAPICDWATECDVWASTRSADRRNARRPANHQETEYLSITHSHVPSFWRRATSEVTVPLRLRVEVRARSPQMSAGRCSPNSNFRFSGPNPV